MTDTDDELEEIAEEVARLERRLEWLEETTVEDIDPPDRADEDVVRGRLKIRRRAIEEDLEDLRERRAELTNEEGAN